MLLLISQKITPKLDYEYNYLVTKCIQKLNLQNFCIYQQAIYIYICACVRVCACQDTKIYLIQ